MAFRLMVFSSELRRDPPKWRTLLTNRNGGPVLKKCRPPVDLTILCMLPMFDAMVERAKKGCLSRAVMTPVSAAPFMFGGFYRTNDGMPFALKNPWNILPPFMRRLRLTQLLTAPGCRCLVKGVDTVVAPAPPATVGSCR